MNWRFIQVDLAETAGSGILNLRINMLVPRWNQHICQAYYFGNELRSESIEGSLSA